MPLAAIERVDIMTDGASSIYGSDAVAGVVNFVLRSHFDGVDAAGTVGATADGGGTTQQYDFLAGRDWQTGGAILTYEFFKQDEILASERSFTSETVPAPTSLTPAIKRNSIFLKLDQQFSDSLSAFVDSIYSHRIVDALDASLAEPASYEVDVDQYGVVVGLRLALARDWQLTLTGDTSQSRDGISGVQGGMETGDTIYTNVLHSLELAASGSILRLPSGNVTGAVGAGYREETFDNQEPTSGSVPSFAASRHSSYQFAELDIPIYGISGPQGDYNRVELDLSGRHEDYSDFGSATDPMAALAYTPIPGLKFHATWGTSFRAPPLQEEYSAHQAYIFAVPNSTLSSSTSPVLFVFGGNPDLQPEKSRSWSLGFDFKPTWRPGLSFNANYYSILYHDRIGFPITNSNESLINPVYAGFLTPNPSVALQNKIIASSSSFLNFSGGPYNPAAIAAVVSDQYHNFSEETITGGDILIDYRWVSSIGNFDAAINSAILSLKQRLLSSSPDVTISGTVFNPPKFRARGSLTWQRGPWTISGFANYVGSSESTAPIEAVASWTTLDAQIAYVGPNHGVFKGFRVALAGQNLADRRPPFVSANATAFPGLTYDSTNASAVGRFISLQIGKSF
jgi:outer membrane receptor protein involved in Fe transport